MIASILPDVDLWLNKLFPAAFHHHGMTHTVAFSVLANTIYQEFISKCDLGLDFHTSTRNRTTMYHVRADMRDPAVERLARTFGRSVILDSE